MPKLLETDLSLDVRLFGPICIFAGGRDVTASLSKRSTWLIAILALSEGKPVDRRKLTGMLWPDSPDAAALHNLRQTLARIRRVLGNDRDCICAEDRSLVLKRSGSVRIDVMEFDEACQSNDPASWERAFELYSDTLIAGCDEPFAVAAREPRGNAFLKMASRLAEHYVGKRELPRADEVLRRVLTEDPYNDAACRKLMSSLFEQGEGIAALELFRKFRSTLRQNLRVDVGAESKALYQSILGALSSSSGKALKPAVRSSIPAPIAPFIGREEEINDVQQLVRRCRLVTLTGPGGVGKTRLSIAVAERVKAKFLDGAAFVDLAPVRDAGSIPDAIATALGVVESARSSTLDQLEAHLLSRDFLLVLDNCEHLVETLATIADRLLTRCEGLHILATSRCSIGVRGEFNRVVLPLSVPEQSHDDTQIAQAEAVRFFLDRTPTKQSNKSNLKTIGAICRRLDGVPLAIELAASRTNVLSVAEIEKHLSKRFALLVDGSGTLERHRSLEASMQWSWEMLSPQEQILLMAISVFRGGCDLAGVRQVVNGEIAESDLLSMLSSIIDRSLVQSITDGDATRYLLLETVREFANEMLIRGGMWELFNDRHRDYYTSWAESRCDVVGGKQKIFMDFEREHDNIRAAIEWCYSRNHYVKAIEICVASARFWDTHGHLDEGRRQVERALQFAPPELTGHLWGRALVHAGWMAACQRDGEAAIQRYEEALKIYREIGDQSLTCVVLNCLGGSLAMVGRYVEAESHYLEALEIAKARGRRWSSIVIAFSNLAEIALAQNEFNKARKLLEDGMSAMEPRIEDFAEVCGILFENLAFTDFREGRYLDAMEHARSALRLFRDADLVVDLPIAILCVALSQYGLGNARLATKLMGSFEKMVDDQSLVPLSFFAQAKHDACENLRRDLGTVAFRDEIQSGREMTTASIIATALCENEPVGIGTKASLI